jgi:enoyl-CoA hydratase/carnithine racemase
MGILGWARMANILWEDHGPVRLITINRPDQMNSLDFAANAELVDVWRAFAADQSVRVAVITGMGEKAFCAGADIKTYTMNFAQRPGHEFRVQFTDGPGFGGITRGLDVAKPTIAAINGFAISGGLELALACDLRFCSPNAEFALQDVRWGLHACDALRIGLVNAIHPDGDLVAKVLRYADMLASRAPLAQQFAKDVMKRAIGLPMDEALRLESRSFHDLGHTKDLAEGTASFREKRPPLFSGH